MKPLYQKIVYISFILYSIFTFSSTSFASLEYDPSLNFKTITTKHFYIHYHKGLGSSAVKLATIAEKVHKRLTKAIKWTPTIKTHVVLVDNMDLANGYASWTPHNKIQIYVYRPDMHEVLNNEDDWLELVFVHEYTHILNIDTVHGFTWFARSVLGRFCLFFPNSFVPTWATEGFAVYQESHKQSFGRNNSTYTDMVMRTEVLANSLKSIDQANGFPREWPRGNVPYLYGGLFVKYLEERFKQGSMADFFIENADNFIPYSDFIYPIPPLFNKDAKDVFGKSFHTLWDDWLDYLKIKYNIQIKKIKEKGITQAKTISNQDDDSQMPRWSPDGKTLYYIKKSPRTYTGLMRYDLLTNKHKRLCQVHYPDSIAISPDGSIFVNDLEYYATYSIYSDVFLYKDGYTQVSSKLRSKYIDLFKDGKSSIFVTFKDSTYSIVTSDLRFDNLNYLLKDSDVQIGYTRLSPDNKQVVFSISDNNGYKDLAIMDIASKKITRLTNDIAKDIQPTWHPDGKKIIFSSDRTGVYNIYEYNLENSQISQLSNTLGGAFNPDVSADGKKIAYASYEKKGYAIKIFNYPDKAFQSEKIQGSVLDPGFFHNALNADYASQAGKYSEDYSIFDSLGPSIHIPLISFSTSQLQLGLFTMGTDVLNKHMYVLQAYVSQNPKQATISANYIYAGLHPNFIFGYYDDTIFWGKDDFPGYDENDENKTSKSRTLNRYGYASIATNFLKFDVQQSLQLSYFIGKEINDKYIPVSMNNPEETTIHDEEISANISLQYLVSSTRSYSYSISPEDGRSLLLYGNYYHKKLGSDTSHYDGMGIYSEYLPGIFDNNALLLQVKGGFSVNEPDSNNLFKLGKKYILQNEPDFTLGLRGYPYEAVSGDRLASATLEYRLPLIQSDFGLLTIPIMFRDLWLAVFFDFGNVWSHEKMDLNKFRKSIGAELHMRLTTGYDFDATAFIGFARGMDNDGEDQIYFAISTVLIGFSGSTQKMIPKKDKYYQQ